MQAQLLACRLSCRRIRLPGKQCRWSSSFHPHKASLRLSPRYFHQQETPRLGSTCTDFLRFDSRWFSAVPIHEDGGSTDPKEHEDEKPSLSTVSLEDAETPSSHPDTTDTTLCTKIIPEDEYGTKEDLLISIQISLEQQVQYHLRRQPLLKQRWEQARKRLRRHEHYIGSPQGQLYTDQIPFPTMSMKDVLGLPIEEGVFTSIVPDDNDGSSLFHVPESTIKADDTLNLVNLEPPVLSENDEYNIFSAVEPNSENDETMLSGKEDSHITPFHTMADEEDAYMYQEQGSLLDLLDDESSQGLGHHETGLLSGHELEEDKSLLRGEASPHSRNDTIGAKDPDTPVGLLDLLDEDPSESLVHDKTVLLSGHDLEEEEDSQLRGAASLLVDSRNPTDPHTLMKSYPSDDLSINSAIEQGMAILCAMRESDWAALEHVETEEDTHDDESEKNTQDIVEPIDNEGRSPTSDTGFNNGGSEELETLDAIEILLEKSEVGRSSLSVDQYNLLMLEFAISSIATDDAIEHLMEIYQQMTELSNAGDESCTPNTSTYLILMLALSRRGNLPTEAVRISRDMMDSGVDLSEDAMVQAMRCFRKVNSVQDGQSLLKMLLTDTSRTRPIPISVFHSLLRMFKHHNMQQEAVELVVSCMEEHHGSHHTLDELVRDALSWPRNGSLDRSKILTGLLEYLEKSSRESGRLYTLSYMPRTSRWKQLIVALSVGSKSEKDVSSNFVRRAFAGLKQSNENYWPDTDLLKYGLIAARSACDAELAADLIVRACNADSKRKQSMSIVVEDTLPTPQANSNEHLDVVNGIEKIEAERHVGKETEGHGGQETERPVGQGVRVPPTAFQTAMRICVDVGDMSSARKILDCLADKKNIIPLTEKRRLFNLALKGYAKVNDCNAAKDLLEAMQQHGPKPSEETYATVIHSLSMVKRTDEAKALLQAMEQDEFGDHVTPGPACFAAGMFSHMQAQAWGEALEFHEKMMLANVSPSPATFQGYVISSFRAGNRETALASIEEVLKSKVELDQTCCELTMKLLLRDIIQVASLADARKKLRELGDQSVELKPFCLNLSRSLRSAEAEHKRKPSKVLPEKELHIRRQRMWHDALSHLLQFTHAAADYDPKKANIET